jgi:hypothetical protein
MKTTVTIDDDVFEAAQKQAQASGKHLGEVLSLLARRGLRVRARTMVRNGLPVFKVATHGKVIPSSRAKNLLATDWL